MNVPGKEGKVKVDRYRYPKGHPKAGRFAPKTEAKRSTLVREVAKKGGKWQRLEKSKSRKKVREANPQTGRAFTGRVRDYSVAESVDEATERGKRVFLKLGGTSFEIPPERIGDLRAFLADMKARHTTTERGTNGGRPYGAQMNVSTGTTGILIDMDSVDFASSEVKEELGTFREIDPEEAQDLADYTARAAEQYLGIQVDPDDIAQGWDDSETDDDFDE